ncbi:conserved hypothetical protein [Desulforamulus reducens MI-1]|uniref:DUF1934 domain-containing protein n=1 Tax=Desulforamulus reducens (strain ATCC BAA-1160 / DSM 100696 / MI-1) TaxID=349161 RepID=A4J9D3_DESRM|nr:DUF1934 domain-containing protein [Desulforamulus reducens]ABO51686.1 conserved hypothetical protein [Desulforamulus reducens MI-1]
MGMNIMLTIKAIRMDPANDEPEITEMVVPGTYHRKNNCYYIIYKESALTGMENTTTTLKVESKTVTIIRNGNVSMRQIYEAGMERSSIYQTSFSRMDMTVTTRNIEVNLTDIGGSIKLDYELLLDHAPLGRNCLEIIVKKA